MTQVELKDSEVTLLKAALSYSMSNLDDLNDALGYDDETIAIRYNLLVDRKQQIRQRITEDEIYLLLSKIETSHCDY